MRQRRECGLAVIGRNVFVLDDVQRLDHESLQIVVRAGDVHQTACRDERPLRDGALAQNTLPGKGCNLVRIMVEIAADAVHFDHLRNIARDQAVVYGEDDLMQYFDGSESIQEKIQSAVVTIENKDGILYGCTKLELNEFLSQEELQEFTEYITGQYSDGWGEGFEQRDIKVDGGTMNVHFWHPNMEQPKMYEKKTEQIPTKPEKQRPKLQLLGHNGNIFSIMGDASTLLKKNKQTAEAKEMCKRVLESGDYYKALLIISEYVETELSPPPKENKKTKKKNQPER